MPRSRVRGGRKAHNKRVKERNEKIKHEYKRATDMAWKKFDEYKSSKKGEDDFQYPEFK